MFNRSFLVGCGVGGGGPYSTLWRLVLDGKPNASTYAIPECEMRAAPGGGDQCVGGTASASSVWSGSYPAAYAFDDFLEAGYWSSAYITASNPNPIYLQYEFLSPVTVKQVALLNGGAYAGTVHAGPAISLEYHDGAGWIRVATWLDQLDATSLYLNVE